MRNINLVVVHCTASDDPIQDSVHAVANLHMGTKGEPITWGKYKTVKRGWDRPGYAYLILKNGTIAKLYTEGKPTWHCKGHNSNSIGIALSGDEDFTPEQFESLNWLVVDICERYGLRTIDVLGHRDLNPNKTCPNFNVAEKLSV